MMKVFVNNTSNRLFIRNNIRSSSSVAIIGAGTCGLSSLKELKNDGLYTLKLFDNSNDIGGQWNVKNKLSNAYSKMWTNTPLDVWFYSDFPYIQNQNNSHFNTVFEQQNKMKEYAKYFGLYEHIQFNSSVSSVISHNVDDPLSEGWTVTYSDGNTTKNEDFDKVVICTGSHNVPVSPNNVSKILSNGRFQGKVYNQQDIDDIDFKNKRVLIIGGSVSGIDLAEHACNEGADDVYLNYRNKLCIIPSYIKQRDGSIVNYHDLFVSRGYPIEDVLQLFEPRGLEKYGFHHPGCNFAEGIPRFSPVKNAIHYMETGKLKGIYGNMTDMEPLSKNVIINSLIDDSDIKLNDIDIVVYTTGFDLGPSSCPLQESIFNKMYNPEYLKKRLLYLNTFIPGYKQSSLAFNGMNVVFTNVTYELQSRLISNVWSNNTTLPETSIQQKWVQDFFNNDPLKWYCAIGAQPLTDEIAEMINVLPKEEDYPNKEMYDRVQHERLFATQFRIKGRNKNPLAIPTLLYQINSDRYDTKQQREMVTGVDGDSPSIMTVLPPTNEAEPKPK